MVIYCIYAKNYQIVMQPTKNYLKYAEQFAQQPFLYLILKNLPHAMNYFARITPIF